MKNSKFVLIATLIALFFLSSGSIKASSVTWLEIKQGQGDKSFALYLKTEGKGAIDIKIIDEKEHVIFSKKIQSVNAFAKKFNLKKLENALYVLQIEDENSITTQPVKIYDEKLEIDPSERRVIYKPVIKFEESIQHLAITWEVNIKDDIRLTIEGDNSGFYFEDFVENQNQMRKRYDISKLERGTYSLSLTCSNQSYFKTIRVE